jgi:hypothetical protein
VALADLTCGTETGSGLITGMTSHVDALIDAQRTGDWITVADIIEYDVGPALEQWPTLLEALRTVASHAAAPATA